MRATQLLPRDTLAERVEAGLRAAILGGDFAVGDKLPSEAQLTEAHGVSRTVVRQAMAALRRAGLVEARQGAGVFVRTLHPPLPQNGGADRAQLASVLEILEIRTPVEAAAAGLAAIRRSPAQEEYLFECLAAFQNSIHADRPGRDADFQLHLAIAEASSNPQFTDFLHNLGTATIPRSRVVELNDRDAQLGYHDQLAAEHEAIVLAISRRDQHAAEQAMRDHLTGSQVRHRALLQQSQTHARPPEPMADPAGR